jgi:hypothetical protein
MRNIILAIALVVSGAVGAVSMPSNSAEAATFKRPCYIRTYQTVIWNGHEYYRLVFIPCPTT